jgi:hypothetical protein
MAQTPEGRVKAEIRKVLDKYKPSLYYDMPVPYGYGKSTLDFVGWFKGRPFAIEAKRAGKQPTDRQEGIIHDMLLAGATVFCIAGEGATAPLEDWLGNVDASVS